MKDSARRFRFAAAYVSYAAVYIARMNLTIAAPALIEEGILTAWQIGLMGGVFFLLYSLGQLLNGWLGDIFSSRRMVTAGLLLTAASNVGIGLLLQADSAVCLWAVNGFAQSMKEAHIPAILECRFPGESQRVEWLLGSRQMRTLDRKFQWHVESGEFQVMAGDNAADILPMGRYEIKVWRKGPGRFWPTHDGRAKPPLANVFYRISYLVMFPLKSAAIIKPLSAMGAWLMGEPTSNFRSRLPFLSMR